MIKESAVPKTAPIQKEYVMERMDYTAGCDMLRKAGFTALEIEQLCKLRNDYTEQGIYRITLAHQYTKDTKWVERFKRKLLDVCISLAASQSGLWMHNHLPY